MATELLVVVATVEAGVLVAVLAVLAGHAGWTRRRGRRSVEALRTARALVQRAVAAPDAVTEAAAAVSALPADLSTAVVVDLSAHVGGAGRQRLEQVARAAGMQDIARDWCRSRWWWRRLRGLRLLARLGGHEDVVRALLHDRHPAVRAAAADAAVDAGAAVSTESAARLLQMLADPDPACRFAAEAALLRAGSGVGVPLIAYLRDPHSPRLGVALEVAAAVATPQLATACLPLAADPRPDIRAAVARLLAAAGGSAATEALQQLLADPTAEVRGAALTGLGELRHWPSGGRMSAALADPAWEVRRAAGFALRRLGAPGTLHLRRALRGTDAFAADMARQMLDLPEGAEAATA